MSVADPVSPAGPKGSLPPLGLRLGVILSLLFLLIGFVSISWTPYPLDRVSVAEQLQDPGILHWLGTDHQGRDLLSLAMRGMLTSFVVSAVAVAIGFAFGVPLGVAVAGWGRRMGSTGDFLLLFPALVVAILIAATSGPGAVSAMIAIGVVEIGIFTGATSDAVAKLGRHAYVDAARLAGMNAWEAAKRHVLPELSRHLLLQVVIQLATGVLAEATLSYVGLGTQPPGTSLGLMLREAQSFVLFEPQLALVPGIAIVAIVLCLNLVADGLGKYWGGGGVAA